MATRNKLRQSLRGPFDVKIGPLDAYNKDEGSNLARMSIDKQFHGDLEETSKGEMLANGNGAKDSSGGYVAIEKITGALHGRSGSLARRCIAEFAGEV